MADRTESILNLLNQGLLDEAIQELKTLEFRSRGENTDAVVLSAALERLRWRTRRELHSLDEFEKEKERIKKAVVEALDRLSGSPHKSIVGAPAEAADSYQLSTTRGNGSEGVGNVLLLVHGMKSSASWFELTNQLMTYSVPCQVAPVNYGYLDLPQFVWPFGREKSQPVQKIKDEIRGVKAKYKNARISILAHSYGTVALMHALVDPTIQVDRVILCGSIVPEQWYFERYLLLGTETTCIVNDCGGRDVWPVTAKCLAWGFGATGTIGFGKAGIRDRLFPLSHGGFFSAAFINQYWVPFVRDGTIISPGIGERPSRLLSILSSNWVSRVIRLVVWTGTGICIGTLLRFVWQLRS
jgi:pimeloyl-ACP methyl ester carboxylesterase